MRTSILVLAVSALLWGCASPEQLAERDRNICLGYGAQPGTNLFVNCMMQQSAQRQAAIQAFGENLQRIGAEDAAAKNAAAASLAARRPIQCMGSSSANSYGGGYSYNTTCY